MIVKSNPTIEKKLDATSDSAFKESMAKMHAFNEELKKVRCVEGLRRSASEP